MGVHLGKLQSTQDGVEVGSSLDNQRGQSGQDDPFAFLRTMPGGDQMADLFSTLIGGQVQTADVFLQAGQAQQNDPGFCIPAEFAGVFVEPDGTLQAGVTICAEEVQVADAGGGGGGFGPLPGTPVIPPVLELLAERRARRGQEGANLLAAAQQTVAPGATVFPGFESGGLADVLMGLITGKGVDAAKGIIPDAARQVVRQHLPTEPSVESELPASLAQAQQILDAIRVVR